LSRGQHVEPVEQFAQRVSGRDRLAILLRDPRLPRAELEDADDHARVCLTELGQSHHLVVAARQAQDAGLTVTQLHTSWLDTPPEEAVIQARVEADQEAARSEQVNDAVSKILDALRSSGYEPALRIKDVEVRGTA